MSNYSGNGRGALPRVEGAQGLDLRRLRRANVLHPGTRTGWVWTSDGETRARALLLVEDSAVAVCWGAGQEQRLDLERRPQPFGGTRAFWRCAACRRRCEAVFYGSGRWACRRCQGLRYESQRLAGEWRLRHKVSKLERRLGSTWEDTHVQKPPGMHWRTFHRRMDELDRASLRWGFAFCAGAARMVRRIVPGFTLPHGP